MDARSFTTRWRLNLIQRCSDLFLEVRLLALLAKENQGRADYFPLALDRRKTAFVSAPLIVKSHRQFEVTILRMREALTGAPAADRNQFLCSMYYLSGWCVGDFGKDYGPEHLLSARFVFQLTKKHPENLALGDHVAQCVRMLGIACRRYGDRPITSNNPNGSFFWKSTFSPVVGWMHAAALGLTWRERTTLHPVKMEWMFGAPRKFRLWFLRGIADSDATVNLRNKVVEIISSPNTYFFGDLFTSLGIKNVIRFSNGYGYVAVDAPAAARIRIFSPAVPTHRRKMLEKLVSAKTFHPHWPAWLEDLVQALIVKGLPAPEIRNRLLDDHNVYVKIHTIKRKIRKANLLRGIK
jgi:hypothetical protein